MFTVNAWALLLAVVVVVCLYYRKMMLLRIEALEYRAKISASKLRTSANTLKGKHGIIVKFHENQQAEWLELIAKQLDDCANSSEVEG